MERVSVRGADDWNRLCRTTFVPLHTFATPGFSATAEVRAIADISVVSMTSGPTTVIRDHGLVAGAPASDVLLTVVKTGAASVVAGERTERITTGAAVACWAGLPYRLSCSASQTLTVRLPRALLDVTDRELRDAHGVAMDPTEAAVASLLQFVLTAFERGTGGPRHQGALERATSALVGNVVLSRAASTTLDRDEALFLRVCGTLDLRATDPGLTLDAVARESGASRRKIELVFAAHQTTPAAYRRRVQLRRARTLLAQDTGGQWSVTALGHAVGFGDTTAFIRAFRREFGTTPAAWRSQRASLDTTACHHQVQVEPLGLT